MHGSLMQGVVGVVRPKTAVADLVVGVRFVEPLVVAGLVGGALEIIV